MREISHALIIVEPFTMTGVETIKEEHWGSRCNRQVFLLQLLLLCLEYSLSARTVSFLPQGRLYLYAVSTHGPLRRSNANYACLDFTFSFDL